MHFRSKQKCTRYGFQGKKHYAASHTNPELPKFTFGGVLPNTIPLNGHFNHFLFCQFDCPQLVSRTSSNCEIKGDNNLTMVHPTQILIASKATFWEALFLDNEIGNEGGRFSTISCQHFFDFIFQGESIFHNICMKQIQTREVENCYFQSLLFT